VVCRTHYSVKSIFKDVFGHLLCKSASIENLISLYCMMALKSELEKLRIHNTPTKFKSQNNLFCIQKLNANYFNEPGSIIQ
jgi:hypothetical protein